MNWSKAPVLIRDLRIGYMIPELRILVAKKTVMHVARIVYGAVCLVIVLPIIAISATGQVVTALGEWLGDVIDPIWEPSKWLKRQEQLNIKASHEIVAVEEIRRRAFGEFQPKVMPK